MLDSQVFLNYFRQRNRGWVFSLLAIVTLIYLPFIGNHFIFDDWGFFSGSMPSFFANMDLFQFNLRGFSYASLAWTWVLFVDAPHPYRLGNLLLHGANVVVLFFILRLLATLPFNINDRTRFSDAGAWLGALFFACHPIATYAVGYVVQRSILMATLFTLAMQLTYIRGLVSEHKNDRWLWLALSVVFYFLAVFSKEHSLMAPATLLVTTILLRSKILVDKKTLLITWFGYLAIGVLVVLSVKGIIGIAYETDAPMLFEQLEIKSSAATLHILSLLTQTGLFFKYLFLWLLPNPAWISIDMRETFASSLTNWHNWIGVICFIVYAVIAVKLLVRNDKLKLAGWALLYPWIFFVVEFSSIRVQEPFVLYRSYLWLPGIMLLFPLLLDSLLHRKQALIALTIIAFSFIPLSWNRLWVLADEYRLWTDAALLLPHEPVAGAARIYYNRANSELAVKHWSMAILDYKKVRAINPRIAQVYKNMGVAYFGLGKYKEALTEFNQAISLKPDYADAYYGKGVTLKRLQANEESLIYIQKSCDFGNITACVIIGFSYSRK